VQPSLAPREAAGALALRVQSFRFGSLWQLPGWDSLPTVDCCRVGTPSPTVDSCRVGLPPYCLRQLQGWDSSLLSTVAGWDPSLLSTVAGVGLLPTVDTGGLALPRESQSRSHVDLAW